VLAAARLLVLLLHISLLSPVCVCVCVCLCVCVCVFSAVTCLRMCVCARTCVVKKVGEESIYVSFSLSACLCVCGRVGVWVFRCIGVWVCGCVRLNLSSILTLHPLSTPFTHNQVHTSQICICTYRIQNLKIWKSENGYTITRRRCGA